MSPGSEREKRLALFAQEMIVGISDAQQRLYWDNVRNYALRQVQARHAFPAGRRMLGLALVGIGVTFWFFAGMGWLHLIENPSWRSLASGPEADSLSAPILVLLGSVSLLMATTYQYKMRTEERKLAGRVYPPKNKRYLYAQHFGLALTAHALGLMMSVTLQNADRSDIVAVLYLGSLFTGASLSFYSWSQMKPVLPPDVRSDTHLFDTVKEEFHNEAEGHDDRKNHFGYL